MKVYKFYDGKVVAREVADKQRKDGTYKATEPTGLEFSCRTLLHRSEFDLSAKEAIQSEVNRIKQRIANHEYGIACAKEQLAKVEAML